MLVSAYLYSPSVFTRFLQKRDFSAEDQMAARLGTLALPGDRVLFLRSADTLRSNGLRVGSKILYWLARRYPVTPFVDVDVQTTYLLFRQPELLTQALDDPKLKLVEFDPQHLGFDDPRFLSSEHHRNLIQRFSERLQERFTRIQDAETPLSLWVRQPDQH